MQQDIYKIGPEIVLEPTGTTDLDSFNLPNQNIRLLRVKLQEIPELYGLAFTLEFDERYFPLVYPVGEGDWNYTARRLNELDFVQTKTDGVGTIPQGVLVNFYFDVNPEIPNELLDATTRIRIKNIKAVRSDGSEIEVGAMGVEVTFVQLETSNKEVAENEFKIFPNPSSGLFHIQSQVQLIDNIIVFNALGQYVFQKNHAPTQQMEVDLQDLPNGIYFLNLFSKDKNWLEKVIIK